MQQTGIGKRLYIEALGARHGQGVGCVPPGRKDQYETRDLSAEGPFSSVTCYSFCAVCHNTRALGFMIYDL
jgi:hypothetical protein